MPLMGYGADWRNFADAVERARRSATNAGHDIAGLFVAVTESLLAGLARTTG
jgi:DNA-damage-inducible protein D